MLNHVRVSAHFWNSAVLAAAVLTKGVRAETGVSVMAAYMACSEAAQSCFSRFCANCTASTCSTKSNKGVLMCWEQFEKK